MKSRKPSTSVKTGQIGDTHPAWKGRGKDYQKIKSREYLRRLRNSVIEVLGGSCVKCGFNDKRALQIDHIDGGGSVERKSRSFTGNFHKNVIKSCLSKENKYQLLCANCNWIKRFEMNEHRK